jgi:hypothetical protein
MKCNFTSMEKMITINYVMMYLNDKPRQHKALDVVNLGY